MNTFDRLLKTEPTLAAQLVERVARGAKLLDESQPGWRERIRADELAMETCDQCVLGQLYGDYATGFKEMLKPFDSRVQFSSGDHGFTLRDSEQGPLRLQGQPIPRHILFRFAALAELWRREVRRVQT